MSFQGAGRGARPPSVRRGASAFHLKRKTRFFALLRMKMDNRIFRCFNIAKKLFCSTPHIILHLSSQYLLPLLMYALHTQSGCSDTIHTCVQVREPPPSMTVQKIVPNLAEAHTLCHPADMLKQRMLVRLIALHRRRTSISVQKDPLK